MRGRGRGGGGLDDVTERCLATFLGSPTLLLTVPQLFTAVTAVTTEVASIIIVAQVRVSSCCLQYTVSKVDEKFRFIERVALVQSYMEQICPFTYFPSQDCKFLVASGVFHSSEEYSVICN